MYTLQEIMTYVKEENVQFIRLACCDIHGRQKNISIMPGELERAFTKGVSFDTWAIAGFDDEVKSDLFLHPDPSTLTVLPWRPANGRVVRMFCDICRPDGSRYERDGRYLLQQAVAAAGQMGVSCSFGAEVEFYLFRADEQGNPTPTPFDAAGYMDIAPEDKGENVRREICFTLLEMGIQPESSHHEKGPGQNEVDFRCSDPLTAADQVVTFQSVVKTVATRNGLYADFSPKPIKGQTGNGMHVNMSVRSADGRDCLRPFMAGVLNHIRELTFFLNPSEESYRRLGEKAAPQYITWSPENHSQLVRIPAERGERARMELRSPDPTANPYVAFALLLHAGLDGIRRGLDPGEPSNVNLFLADDSVTAGFEKLPATRAQALALARQSAFVAAHLPAGYLAQF